MAEQAAVEQQRFDGPSTVVAGSNNAQNPQPDSDTSTLDDEKGYCILLFYFILFLSYFMLLVILCFYDIL